jgi:hypothetical protein
VAFEGHLGMERIAHLRSGGTKWHDRLIGGPGRDRADGRKGRDTCRAEKRKRCEVTL